MTDRWKDRLSEFLDGELGEREQVELEWHLQSCLECRRLLAELRELKSHVAALADREPASDLWPGIAARLNTAPQIDIASMKVIDLRQRKAVRAARRVSLSLPQLAAAGITLMLLSGSAVWFVLSGRMGTPAGTETTPVVTQVANRVSEPTDYTSAVQSLETALRQQRDRLDPVTVTILEENLRAIDTAITEARVALQRDPGNLYLNQHLENTMKKKIQLLRRATALRGA